MSASSYRKDLKQTTQPEVARQARKDGIEHKRQHQREQAVSERRESKEEASDLSSVISVEPIEGVGAVVRGVDLRKPLHPNTVACLKKHFLEYHVLVFSGNNDLTEDQHVRFTSYFGKPVAHPVIQTAPGNRSEIRIVSNKAGPNGLGSKEVDWHSDMAYRTVPTLISILYGELIPKGSTTWFANCRTAYDALTDDVKQKIKGRKARHYIDSVRNDVESEQPVMHPLARAHPETGKKSLFVNSWTQSVTGTPEEESKELCKQLLGHITSDKFVYKHKWSVGDVVMWDNRCTLHYRPGWIPEEVGDRVLKRTQIVGDNPQEELE